MLDVSLTRRDFLRKTSLGLAGVMTFGPRYSFAQQTAKRSPNIIFIFIDDMGYGDPNCYGNKHIQTPNIDRLAAEGARFTQFYVNSPICSPSRVAVTTGQYPARRRIHSFLNSRKSNRTRDMADFLAPKAPPAATRCDEVASRREMVPNLR